MGIFWDLLLAPWTAPNRTLCVVISRLRLLQHGVNTAFAHKHWALSSFFLQVVGLPTPDISWYLDGKPIRPDDYHKMLVCEKSVHSFIIEIVTIHHAGVYECVAKNRAGESHFSVHLDVIGEQFSYLYNIKSKVIYSLIVFFYFEINCLVKVFISFHCFTLSCC